MKGLVAAQPIAVGKAAGSYNYRADERRQCMGRRDGVGTPMHKGHALLELGRKFYALQKGEEARQSSKGSHCLLRAA